MKRDHYVEAKTEVEKKCSEKTQKIWNYMLIGRTLLDGSEIAISSDGRKLGYWTVKEQNYLSGELKMVFGKTALLNGIKYVQQVLEETANNNSEIIILSE